MDNINILSQVLTKNKKIHIKIIGDSMLPTLHPGQKVLVEETDNYAVGDIVAYFLGKKLIVHRIYDLNSNFFIAKGDNKLTLDPCTSVQNILGVVNIPSLKKYKKGPYKYKATIINNSNLLFSYKDSNYTNNIDGEKIKVGIFLHSVYTDIYDQLSTMTIPQNVSGLEFHIIADKCIENYINTFDLSIGVGRTIDFNLQDDRCKEAYILGQIDLLRQRIDKYIGGYRYGRNTWLD